MTRIQYFDIADSETMDIGTVVTIVSTNKEGRTTRIFRDARGLNDSKLSLSKRSLSTVLRNIAARSGDPLAPLKAVTSFINELHRANIEGWGSQMLHVGFRSR